MNPNRYKQAREFIIRIEDRPGLEVVMRPISFGKIQDLAELADDYAGGRASTAQVSELSAAFAGKLVGWNIDDENDQPVPATAEGVRSLDADLFMDILTGWFEGMTKAPKASTKPAEPSGGLSLQDLPMAPLRAV